MRVGGWPREAAENQNRSQQDKLNAKHRPRQGCAVLVRDVGDASGSRHAAAATMKTRNRHCLPRTAVAEAGTRFAVI